MLLARLVVVLGVSSRSPVGGKIHAYHDCRYGHADDEYLYGFTVSNPVEIPIEIKPMKAVPGRSQKDHHNNWLLDQHPSDAIEHILLDLLLRVPPPFSKVRLVLDLY